MKSSVFSSFFEENERFCRVFLSLFEQNERFCKVFSDHLYTWNDETVDSALKNASLELNMIDFSKICEDHLYIMTRENMIFSLKKNDFFNEF